jgi:hypothetical protein
MKFDAIVALSLLSWAVFGAGIFLAGFEGYEYLKELWKQRTRAGRAEYQKRNGSSQKEKDPL